MKLREPKCDCEHKRVAQRVAKLEEQRFAAMKRIGTLEAENARLREENRRLREENGQKFWTWCFRAQVYTLFRIDKSRPIESAAGGAGRGVQRRAV